MSKSNIIIKKGINNEYIKFEQMLSSDLNQQKIEEFFEADSSKQQSHFKKDEVSLNFTVTSRDSRNPQKSKDDLRKVSNNDTEQAFLTIAQNQIKKFNCSLISDNQKIKKLIDLVSDCEKITPIVNRKSNSIAFTEIQLLKKQVNLMKQSVKKSCHQCRNSDEIMNIIKSQCEDRLENIEVTYKQKISKIQQSWQKETINSIKQKLIDGAQLNLLIQQNLNLRQKINHLNADKENFQIERSALFYKTKTLQEKLKTELTRSKGMSATKNSLSGADSLHRPADSFLFDPSEADYDDWLSIFTQHSQALHTKCRLLKDQLKNKKQLTLEDKQAYNSNPNFLLYSKYRKIIDIIRQIKEIKAKHGIQFQKSLFRQPRNSTIFGSNKQKSQNYEEIEQQLKQLKKKNICLTNENRNLQEMIVDIRQVIKKHEEDIKIWEDRYQESQDQYHQKIQQNLMKIEALQNKIQEEEYKSTDAIRKLQYQSRQVKFLQKTIQDLTSKRQSLEIQNKDLEFKFNKEKLERKKLHSQLEGIKGSVKIFCRIRPKFKNQIHSNVIVKAVEDSIVLDKGKRYKFDGIFKQNSKQQQIFHENKKMIQSAFEGNNLCFFNYGQTGAGKTFTIHGNKQNPGLTPRIIEEVFKIIESQKGFFSTIVEMNFIELYMDSITDLFGVVTKQGIKIDIKEDSEGNINFINCPRIRVNNVQQMLEAYHGAIQGRKNMYSQTDIDSSKSHCIFIIRLQIENKKTKEKKFSKICLVDLAGSEKLTTSNPIHQKEASSININLTSLSKVINCLQNRDKFIPFRDSKLTYLLKDILTPNSKILIFINISSCENNRIETTNSLEFINKIRKNQKGQKSPIEQKNQPDYKEKNRRSISSFSDI